MRPAILLHSVFRLPALGFVALKPVLHVPESIVSYTVQRSVLPFLLRLKLLQVIDVDDCRRPLPLPCWRPSARLVFQEAAAVLRFANRATNKNTPEARRLNIVVLLQVGEVGVQQMGRWKGL